MNTKHPNYPEILTDWCEDTLIYSSPGQMMSHPLWRNVTLGGADIMEECIQRLEKGDHLIQYMLVLGRLTNYNPVPEEDRGRVAKMALHWITWYRKFRLTQELYVPGQVGDDDDDKPEAAQEVRVAEADAETQHPDGDDRS